MAWGVLEPRGKATHKALPLLNPPPGYKYADRHLICVWEGTHPSIRRSPLDLCMEAAGSTPIRRSQLDLCMGANLVIRTSPLDLCMGGNLKA